MLILNVLIYILATILIPPAAVYAWEQGEKVAALLLGAAFLIMVYIVVDSIGLMVYL